jgi:phosphoribosylaminoimidazole (AIR) synthetase
MGVGMALVVPPHEEKAAAKILDDEGEDVWTIGKIVQGSGIVRFKKR